MAQPGVRLAAGLVLLAGLPLAGQDVAGPLAVGEVGGEVGCDEAGLGEDEGFRGGRGLQGEDGGFAEGVDLEERRGGFEGRAVVDLDFVGQVELLEEPEDALGARLVQPVVGPVSVGLAGSQRWAGCWEVGFTSGR